MKFYILILIVFFGLSVEAVEINKILPNGDVTIELIADTKFDFKPIFTIYQGTEYINPNSLTDQQGVKPDSISHKKYIFKLHHQEKSQYFSIVLQSNSHRYRIIDMFHFEPGDNVHIIVKELNAGGGFQLEFSGRGAAKYEVRNKLSYRPILSNKNEIESALSLIEDYRTRLSDTSYDLLRADAIGLIQEQLFRNWFVELEDGIAKSKIEFNQAISKYPQAAKFDYHKLLSAKAMIKSKNYSQSLVIKISGESFANLGKIDYENCFNEIKKIENTSLRDKMVVVFFLRYWTKINKGYDKMLNESISIVTDVRLLKKLKELKNNSAGLKAINFQLPDVNGRIFTLNQFIGKVVFIDFWFTGCVHCSSYFKRHLNSVEKYFQDNKDVVFITINVDMDKNLWINSVNSGEYTSKDVINLNTNGEGVNHEFTKYYNVYTFPKPMLIGKDGHIFKFAGNEMRKADNLMREINNALASNR